MWYFAKLITVSTCTDVLSWDLDDDDDPWVESHMWPQQTWGQRSSRGQWPLVQVFGKKGQCIHIVWCIFKSNITMIAKVCDHESRRDTWFENRLVDNNKTSSAHSSFDLGKNCWQVTTKQPFICSTLQVFNLLGLNFLFSWRNKITASKTQNRPVTGAVR